LSLLLIALGGAYLVVVAPVLDLYAGRQTALEDRRMVLPRLFAAAAGASLAITLISCFASYGIWEEWWLGTLWFSLFVIIVMARVAHPAVMPAGNVQPQPFVARLGLSGRRWWPG